MEKMEEVKVQMAINANGELDPLASPLILDPSQFHGSMHEGKSETDTNCWMTPNGTGFMIRGKTYLTDNTKVGYY